MTASGSTVQQGLQAVANTDAVVLCGGRSQRMGTDKCLLKVGSEAMLQRICRLLGSVTDQIVVVAAATQTLPPLPGQVVICRDEYPDAGPLAGLTTGLAVINATRRQQSSRHTPHSGQRPAVYVCGCDSPFLHPQVVQQLSARLGTRDAVIVNHRGRDQFLNAVYASSVEATARQLIESGEPRMQSLVNMLDTIRVDSAEFTGVDPELQTFQNLNTPDEFQRAVEAFAADESN
jgi:molybdopterin-guanine dinucleotide biosynthesis protein A